MTKEKVKKSPQKEYKEAKAPDGLEMTRDDLKSFLLVLRDRISDKSAAPIYALGSMNSVLNMPNIQEILNEENKEIARDIWLRIKQSAFHIAVPPILFKPDEIAAMSS